MVINVDGSNGIRRWQHHANGKAYDHTNGKVDGTAVGKIAASEDTSNSIRRWQHHDNGKAYDYANGIGTVIGKLAVSVDASNRAVGMIFNIKIYRWPSVDSA